MESTASSGILWPVLGHLGLVQFLFAMVSWRRRRATREGTLAYDDLAWNGAEPELSRRWAKNLDNQFQLPVLFYALVAMLMATGEVSNIQIGLAWLFLVGRLLHTCVQVTGDNVVLRGRVFIVNYVALSAMWLLFLYDMLVH